MFKTAENVFTSSARTRFGHVVRMHILHADLGDDFRDLEVMQVCTVIEWYDNNITCNFSIAFLPNICKQTRNIAIFAPNFVQREQFVELGCRISGPYRYTYVSLSKECTIVFYAVVILNAVQTSGVTALAAMATRTDTNIGFIKIFKLLSARYRIVQMLPHRSVQR